MDLGIRQSLQQVLQSVNSSGAHVALRCTDARLLIVRSDFVCYENHVEATDEDGRPVTIAYSDIEAVEPTEVVAASPDRN